MENVEGASPMDTTYLRRRARRTVLAWVRFLLDALVAGQEPLGRPAEFELGHDEESDAGDVQTNLGIRLG